MEIITKISKYKIKDTNIVFNEKIKIDNGKIVYDKELEQENDVVLYNIYRKLHNLLLPNEVKKIRNKLNLTQDEFDTLLGFDKNTIKIIENGSIQSVYQDKMIRKWK